MIAELYLKKDQDRRLRAGHCWVYSNEVDTAKTPFRDFAAGDPVSVLNHQGRWVGWAYINPNSLITARIVSRDRRFGLDRSLFVHKLKVALSMRERLYQHPYYRLVFGESDGLPGLVVDRYGDQSVVQINTAGMERQRDAIVEALDKVLRPRAILLRNDSLARSQEGLMRYVEVATGELVSNTEVPEGGLRFYISLTDGQKTGWFYDQTGNRDRLMKYVPGKRVLDVCSYVGAWGVRAAAAGADKVICVDTSEQALEGVETNAQANGVAERVFVGQGDAFSALKQLKADGERYDVVILDPPAFIKRRKDVKAGTLAYRRLNEAALGLREKDSLLVTASCSAHMAADSLLRVVQQAARHNDRHLQLLEQGHQGPDHPIHPAIPETAYLKAFYLRVLPSL